MHEPSLISVRVMPFMVLLLPVKWDCQPPQLVIITQQGHNHLLTVHQNFGIVCSEVWYLSQMMDPPHPYPTIYIECMPSKFFTEKKW